MIAKRFTDPVPARAPPPARGARRRWSRRSCRRSPGSRPTGFASAAAFAEALTAPADGAARPPVGRGAAVPQPERRPGERVLRRRDHRGRHRPALEDPLAQGDLAHLGDAVQAAGAEPAGDRRDAATSRRCSRAACAGPATGCGSSPSSSTPRPTSTSGPRRTTASSPTSSRSRPTWRCRSPPRSRPSCRRTSGPGSAGSRRPTSRPTSSTSRGGTATPGTPRRASGRASSTSSRRSRPTPGMPWPTSASALAYAELAAGQGGGTLRPDEAYQRGHGGRRQGAGARPRAGRGARGAGPAQVRPRLRLGGRRGGVQAGARAEPGRGRHLRSLRLALLRARALRRGAGAGAAGAGARPAGAPGGRRDDAPARGPATRRRCEAALTLRRVRARVRAGALHAGVGLPEERRCRTRVWPSWSGRCALAPGNTLWLAQLGEAYAMAGAAGEGAGDAATAGGAVRGSGTSRPTIWRTCTPGSGSTIRRWICWSGRTRSGRAACTAIKGSFLFTSLRSHPRFKALLTRMNLA